MIKGSHKERYFTTFTWYFLAVMLLYVVIKDSFTNFNLNNMLKDTIFLGIFASINLIRKFLLDFGVYELDYFYLRSRLIEVFLICFAFFYLGFSSWIAGFILGMVIIVTVLEGKQVGLHTTLLSFLVSIFFVGLTRGLSNRVQAENISFLLLIASGAAVWYVMAKISQEKYDDNKRNEDEYQSIVKEKEQALELLKDSDEKNEKIKEKIKNLEDINEEFKLILNKYYEFHHISSIIGSIYDINGLMKFMNETIIEIIEADYSTIFLFEPKRGSLEIQNTNIINEDNLQKLKKNINNDIIFDIIENGTPFVVNFVESSDDYEFVRGRDVKSFACMPISTTKKKYGVVLIESNEFNKFHDENQKLIMLIGHQLSTSIENLELYKRMKELATTDGLTGIYNRLYFQERLSKELKIAHEHDYPLSLVIFDIDHFKKVNDTYSHLIGDKVLKVVTSVVKNSIRRSDMIARYGGEEFIILFPNMDLKRAEETCENLRKKIEATPVTSGSINLSVTASFGVSNYPENAHGEENLVKAADRALYEAKGTGRNQVKVSKEQLF